jgi:hypothetical protein
LHTGKNEIVVFDLDGGASASVRGDAEPTYLKPVVAAAR